MMRRIRWSNLEERALVEGVKKHGVGRWKKILLDPHFSKILVRRSNINIKDKWRNLSNRVEEENHITIAFLITDDIQTSAALDDDDDKSENVIHPHEKKSDIHEKKVDAHEKEADTREKKADTRINIRDHVATETPSPERQSKRPKLWHDPCLVLSEPEALEDEENKTHSQEKEEEVGVLKQGLQYIFGTCKKAITWSPFGSTPRNE